MKALQLKYPLVVAPMAGGPTTPELVIASSEAGALGFYGAAYTPAVGIKKFVEEVRAKTQKPFGINLFVPSRIAKVSDGALSVAIQTTQKYRDELKLPPPKLEPPYEEDFDSQFEAMLAAKPNVFSFVFGMLGKEYLSAARKLGISIMGNATTLAEALLLQEAGVDAIVAQGVEAGGHRAIFDSTAEDPNVECLALVRQLKGKIRIPIIAAGGIMTKSDIRLRLAEGVAAVQMGTAFLATKEAGTSAPYRKQLMKDRETKLTRVFSGRLARGITNRFLEEMEGEKLLPFPAQNKFTRDLRSASVAFGSSEFLSLWSGSGKGDLWTGSAADLIKQLFSN